MSLENAIPNDSELDVMNRLQNDNEVITTTPMKNASLSFIEKCIHPPSAVPGYRGLPTNDTRSQVNLEWRNLDFLRPTTFLDSDSIVKLWNTRYPSAPITAYAFLITNGARVQIKTFFQNNQTGVWQEDLANTFTNELYDWTRFQSDATVFRPTYKSTTAYLNATAFNDTGAVTANQFNPNIMFGGTIGEMATQRPDLFNMLVLDGFRKNRYSMVSPKHKDFDLNLVRYGKIPHYLRAELHRKLNIEEHAVLNLDPDSAAQIINFGMNANATPGGSLAVPTLSQSMQNSARSYAGKARDGAFIVQRLNTISPNWNTAGNIFSGQNGLYQCYGYFIDVISGPSLFPMTDNVAPQTGIITLPILLDTLWTKDMTFSWLRFDGLSYNTTALILNQLILLKRYTGYEVQPAMASSWSGMMELAPKPNLEAMQGLMDAFYEIKDAMPAKYNFFGALGTLAANGLKTFGSTILKELTNSITGSKDEKKEKQESKKEKKKVHPSASLKRPKQTKKTLAKQPTARKEKAEINDVDKQIHALNRKIDLMMKPQVKLANNGFTKPKALNQRKRFQK